MRRLIVLGVAMLGGLLPAALPERGEAQNVVNAVRATAAPSRFVGRCPAIITFTGTFYVNQPTVVNYQWERSDQAVSPVQSVNVTGASQSVTIGWQLSGPTGTAVNGWQVLRVLSPGNLVSNTASFSLTCQ